jgi:hypothetical protein
MMPVVGRKFGVGMGVLVQDIGFLLKMLGWKLTDFRP